MMTLGKYHHDFPQLAKQSGFYFQLQKGKVNWAEIENLNIDDVIENRNFQLLEQNLINVINCNLEKEYDLKVLDQNFVKLFKVAQLGVDYLSYCEAYLDKCVVILQEQLIAFQEECESLKYEKEKRKEEEIRNGRKNKTRSYQCEKCDKAFISDAYLKFHDKRRHNIPNPTKSFDGTTKKYTDNSQQTQGERKSTASTQTSFPNSRVAATQDDEYDTVKIKMQQTIKIENLEQEIQDLKDRLKKAENALTEKTEPYKPNGFHSPFPGPTCHNTMLLLLPPCQKQSISSYEEVKPTVLITTPEILQHNNSQEQVPVDPVTVENKPSSENSIQFNIELENDFEKKENGPPKAEVEFHAAAEDVESSAEHKRGTEDHLECEKENVDPGKLSKPLPPPRKSKKPTPKRLEAEDNPMVEMSVQVKGSTQAEFEVESCTNQPIIVTSTPVKTSSFDTFEGWRENSGDLSKRVSISNESLFSRKSTSVEDSSTSFFKTMVRKNSPKLRTFGQNIRRSLINLRDSVSSTGKDFVKKESVDDNVKADVVNGLNNRLRQLGVDPEWSGIPKKTMKEKLKALKHRRKLLAKENPMYPVIRRNIEETIFQKLKKNFGSRGTNFKKKLAEQPSTSDVDDPPGPTPNNESEEVKPQSCVMYDIESDSESKTSDSEINFYPDVGRNISQKTVELSDEPDLQTTGASKEFDLTVFQVGSFKKITRNDVSVRVEELLTDSDGDFSDKHSLKALKKLLASDEVVEDDDGHNKPGNQSILKGAGGFQSTLQLNGKKKVCFFNNSKAIEEVLSDSPTDEDDLWSLKSDWEKNVK